MAGRANPNTIMEEEDEDQQSTQNNNPRVIEEERRMNNKNMFDQLLMNKQNSGSSGNLNVGGRDVYSTTPRIVNQGANRMQEEDNRKQQDDFENGNQMEEVHLEYDIEVFGQSQKESEELPDEIKSLIQYDESLYDLMRHKTRFKFQFGKELTVLTQSQHTQTQSQNPFSNELEKLSGNYICFNGFFFHKNLLQERNVLEIHHSQTTEKNQIYHFIVSELLRDQAGKDIKDQSKISPEILYFDNTQQISYSYLKQLIKQQLKTINYFKQSIASQNSQQTSQQNDQVMDSMFDSISENCLSKLHVISSHSQLEFCANIRAIKHILNKKKSIRVVIVDEINAFYVDNENTYTVHHHKTPSKEDDEDNANLNLSNNQKKKKKAATTSHFIHPKTNINKQFDSYVKEYLEEIYKKFIRVSFIQSRRDYFKVRNLIDYQNGAFVANDELIQIFTKDNLNGNQLDDKRYELDFEFQNIYCLTLDNFSVAAIEKAMELIRGEQTNTEVYINPQKVSAVLKRNYFQMKMIITLLKTTTN